MYLGRPVAHADAAGAASRRVTEPTRSTSRCCSSACSQPLLGVGDPRTDKRIDFVGGIRGTDELERLVDERQGGRGILDVSRSASTI